MASVSSAGPSSEQDLPPISVPIPRWHFTNEEIHNKSASRPHMKYEAELQKRQSAARFIQKLADRLNTGIKDQRNKISQLCVCATTVHMNRFFFFHSFETFDYRDVCAACLFMCGKSEECPRKLEHVVRNWWALRFEGSSITDKYYADATNKIILLETIILQTIAFDLRVDLPHTVVLQQMQEIGHDRSGKRMLTEAAYFFATDVLCVTDWSIRYKAPEIAAICIYAVCVWANHQIVTDKQPWYYFAPELNEEKLKAATNEFLTVYKSLKDLQGLRLAKFVQKGQIVPRPLEGAGNIGVPPIYENAHIKRTEAESLLPPPPPPPAIPPPPPPAMTKKMDYQEYKKRRSPPSSAKPPADPASTTRVNFMPDLNNIGKMKIPEMKPLYNGNGDAHVAKEHKERKPSREHKDKEHKEHKEAKRPKDRETRPEDRERHRDHHHHRDSHHHHHEHRERKRPHEHSGGDNWPPSTNNPPSEKKRAQHTPQRESHPGYHKPAHPPLPANGSGAHGEAIDLEDGEVV